MGYAVGHKRESATAGREPPITQTVNHTTTVTRPSVTTKTITKSAPINAEGEERRREAEARLREVETRLRKTERQNEELKRQTEEASG